MILSMASYQNYSLLSHRQTGDLWLYSRHMLIRHDGRDSDDTGFLIFTN